MCLSPDNFSTFYFGTVAGTRDPEKLAKGIFQIKFEIENTAMPKITSLVRYAMLESSVYFEVAFSLSFFLKTEIEISLSLLLLAGISP